MTMCVCARVCLWWWGFPALVTEPDMSVGMRPRAGRLTGLTQKWEAQTNIAQRLLIQPAKRAKTACVSVCNCVWSPWPLAFSTDSHKLHPSCSGKTHTLSSMGFFCTFFPGMFVFYYSGGIWHSLCINVEKEDLERLWIRIWRLSMTQDGCMCLCWGLLRHIFFYKDMRKLLLLINLFKLFNKGVGI